MNKPNRPRGFEDRLLHELKNVVHERSQEMNSTAEIKVSRFSRGRKLSMAGAALGVAAAGIAAVVLPSLTTTPAFAVEPTDDGKVRVEISEPQDAADMEATFAEHGIQAKAAFPPANTYCAPGWYTPDSGAPLEMHGPTTGESLTFVLDPDDFAIGGDRTLIVKIPEGDLANQPTEAVTEAASQHLTSLFGIDEATGEVGECEPVDGDGTAGEN
jgi:hypothetical protein